MARREDKVPLFWHTGIKAIPRRPDNPEAYPEDDARHWYDLEYAGWLVEKMPMPESPMDGPKGKKVAAILPGWHPYAEEFRRGMEDAARRVGMDLRVYSSPWDPEDQKHEVERALSWEPHLVIIWIESLRGGSQLIETIYQAGIPVVAANAPPDEAGLRHVLAWTGPDDWAQFRRLSGRFAELMGFRGGYAIVCHMKDTPTFFARSWSVVTELKETASEMELLAMASTDLDEEKTYRQVKVWLDEFGSRLQGVVSADDERTQLGINRALDEAGRADIIRVANGSTPTGIRLIREGGVDAITFQLAEQDGALPVKLAADWFSGLEIPPIRHLPVRILDAENIDLLVNRKDLVLDIDTDQLYQDILDCRSDAVRQYFARQIDAFARSTDITMEFFRGFSIEIYSNLYHIMKTVDLDEAGIVGSYEEIYKRLFQQPTMERTLNRLEEVSLAIIRRLGVKRSRHSSIVARIIAYVDDHYDEPLSLKTLSYQMGISAPYLGKLFTEEIGEAFTTWLNRRRIDKAIEMMKTTDLSIREIAERVGYVNSNYFYKLFKKYMGLNPGEFQAQLS
ncbi:MAG: helix-turn-helix domain-containing protein [Spirochaetaceae bacterium]|nr:helix-turn-helix domain-containing protein [Spirochaetaceae bacterium]